jgi:hypothetical protein
MLGMVKMLGMAKMGNRENLQSIELGLLLVAFLALLVLACVVRLPQIF